MALRRTLRYAPRVVDVAAPPNVLVTVTIVDATVDEGTDAIWHINFDWQGRTPAATALGIRTMTATEVAGTLAEDSDFTASFIQALDDAIADTSGVTRTTSGNDIILNFAANFSSPFVITWTAFDNPAEQGTKKAGLLVYAIPQGTIVTPSAIVTIADLSSGVALPTNTSVPILSDTTPEVGVAVIGSDGQWDGAPTTFAYQWQQRWFYPDAVLDFDYTNDIFFFNGVEYASVAAMVTAGFYTVDAVKGDRVNLSGLLPTVYTILFKGANAAAITTNESQAALSFDDGEDADEDDERVMIERLLTTSKAIRLSVNSGNALLGAAATSANHSSTVDSATVKIAAKVKTNVFLMSVNGATPNPDLAVAKPVVTRMVVGGSLLAAKLWDGTISRIMVLNRDITSNSDLMTLDVPPNSGDIPGAIAAGYTPTNADKNTAVRFGVIASNAGGSSAVSYSAWSSAIGGATVPINTVLPLLSDTTPIVGEVVTCSQGTWTNSPTGFTYQWQLGSTNIATATNSSYTPVAGDEGFTLRCLVTASNSSGSTIATTLNSSAVAASGGVGVPVLVTAPALSTTTPQQGVALSCSTGAWTNSPTSFAYQWQRANSNIGGATSASYIPVSGDVNSTLRCEVTATNASGSAAAFSAASTAVSATAVPTIVSAPVISDTTPTVGIAISASTGTWNGTPTGFAYQWQKSSVNISGATAALYTPVAGEVGTPLRCLVTASNGGGSSTAAASAQTSNVAAAPAGALTDVTLSSSFILWNGAENTAIGTFAPVGGAIATATFATGGNAGGRVKISGTSGLLIGAVAPDFGIDGRFADTFPQTVDSYSVTINFTGSGGGSFQRTFVLGMRCAKIEPTGGAGGTTVTVDTLAELKAELQSPTTDPRIIRFDTSVNGFLETNGQVPMAIINGKKNFTLVGHRRIIFGKDSSLSFLNCENARIINCAFRVGADVAGKDRGDRDCIDIRYCLDLSFEYCDFSWSIDELVSYIRTANLPPPRRCLFYRCAFYEPLSSSGHGYPNTSTENSHPYGLLLYSQSHICWVIECTFFDCAQRGPTIGTGSRGIVVQNNLSANWGGGGGHGGCMHNDPTVFTNNLNITSHCRGNLGRPGTQASADRNRMYHFSRAGAGGKICIEPPASVNANHLMQGTLSDAPNLAADPYNPANIVLRNSSTLDSVVATPAFEFEGFPCRPTATLADRVALLKLLAGEFDNVVGCRTFAGNGDPLTNAPTPGWRAMSYIGWQAFTRMGRVGNTVNPHGGYMVPPPNGAYVSSDDQVGVNPNRFLDTGVPP